MNHLFGMWVNKKGLPCTSALRCGSNVSQMQMFLPSELCPDVASKLDEPMNAKSVADLLWHFILCNLVQTK